MFFPIQLVGWFYSPVKNVPDNVWHPPLVTLIFRPAERWRLRTVRGAVRQTCGTTVVAPLKKRRTKTLAIFLVLPSLLAPINLNYS